MARKKRKTSISIRVAGGRRRTWTEALRTSIKGGRKTDYVSMHTTSDGEAVAENWTTRQMKEYIRVQRGWSERTYEKKYDIFRNKLRTYEKMKMKMGDTEVTKASPLKELFMDARARARFGPDYKGTMRMREIMATSSRSSGAKALTRLNQSQKWLITRSTNIHLGGFIESSKTAQAIMKNRWFTLKPEEVAKMKPGTYVYSRKDKTYYRVLNAAEKQIAIKKLAHYRDAHMDQTDYDPETGTYSKDRSERYEDAEDDFDDHWEGPDEDDEVDYGNAA